VILKDDDGEVWEGHDAQAARLNTVVAGVHSALAFQCEICWMWNLETRDPDAIADRDYIVCIRRANLDAMNARAADTIKDHMLTTCSLPRLGAVT
jgi:hypothetical protein